MPIISKTSTQLFYDLVNDANSGIEHPFGPTNVKLTPPAKLTEGSVTDFNTRVRVRGVNNVYVNAVNVDLRRIDVALLTRGIALRVPKKSAVTINSTPRPALNLYDLLPTLNRLYGFNFTSDDFANVAFQVSSASPKINGQYSSSLTLTVKPTSLAYFGTVVITWVQSPDNIKDYLVGNKKALSGRLFPGGNDFPAGRKPVGEWQTYGLDATLAKSALDALPNSQTVAVDSANANIVAILNWLNENTADTDYSTASGTSVGGLGGLVWSKVNLPSTLHPEANSAVYNRALIITAKADSWFTGKLIIHYKV